MLYIIRLILSVSVLSILLALFALISLNCDSHAQCYGGRCYTGSRMLYYVPYNSAVSVSPMSNSNRKRAERVPLEEVSTNYFDLDLTVICSKSDEHISKTLDGPDGRRVRCDMPMSLYIRNTGGSDGAGLCVFTSIYHTAVYNGLPLLGYRKYMESRPGGGYPSKVDKTIRDYCSRSGVYVPSYIHVYKKDSLRLVQEAIRRGHMVCITWGTDYSHYGGQTIAHMVNCVYLDDKWGAILDNNYTNEFLWVKRPVFDRYAAHSHWGSDSLWAIIFIDNPIPPLARGQ